MRRVEARLLQAHAGEIIERCGFLPLVELGAGTAEKTRILLAEYAKRDMRCDYFPIDVDTETLFATAYLLAAGFPRLFVHLLGATYQESLRSVDGDLNPPDSGEMRGLVAGGPVMDFRVHLRFVDVVYRVEQARSAAIGGRSWIFCWISSTCSARTIPA